MKEYKKEYEKIVDYVFDNLDCRNKDIISIFIDPTMSEEEKKTVEVRINRKLRKLKKEKTLIYDPNLKQPRYRVNPAIKDITKNWKDQIIKTNQEVEELLKEEAKELDKVIHELEKRKMEITKQILKGKIEDQGENKN